MYPLSNYAKVNSTDLWKLQATFIVQDFIYDYSLLLPKGRLSSRTDIHDFLIKIKADGDGFQIGETKVG